MLAWVDHMLVMIFRSDLGYYRRYGFVKFTPFYQYRIYPKNNNKILNYELQHYAAYVFRPNKAEKFEGRWNILHLK